MLILYLWSLQPNSFTGYQQMAVVRKIKMAVSTDDKSHELVNSKNLIGAIPLCCSTN